MSKLKRSKALRRNLRKQARKGTLSAREKQELLQQEKKFRKARRPFMKGLGATLGAGLGAAGLAMMMDPTVRQTLGSAISDRMSNRPVRDALQQSLAQRIQANMDDRIAMRNLLRDRALNDLNNEGE